MWAIDYDHRSDNGPLLIGPFPTKDAAHRYANRQQEKVMAATGHWSASFCVVPLYEPSGEVVDDAAR